MLEEIVCIWIGRGLYFVGRLVYRLKGLPMESIVLLIAEYIQTCQMGPQQLKGVPLFGLFDLFPGPIARVIIVARMRKIALHVRLDQSRAPS